MLVREGWSLGREGGGGAAGSGGRCAELGRVSDAAWLGLRSGVKALRGRAQPMVPGLRPELRPREPPGLPRFQATLYAEAIGGRTLMGSRGENLVSWILEFRTGGCDIWFVWEFGLYPVAVERREMVGRSTGSV